MAEGVRCPECSRVYTGSDSCPYCEKTANDLVNVEVTAASAAVIVVACSAILVAALIAVAWLFMNGLL